MSSRFPRSMVLLQEAAGVSFIVFAPEPHYPLLLYSISLLLAFTPGYSIQL